LLFASRTGRDLPSSANGSGGPQGNCDNSPTYSSDGTPFFPFVASLGGAEKIGPAADGSACVYTNANTGTYPNYSTLLTAADGSFAVRVTPFLWGGVGQDTILHVDVVSLKANVAIQTLVVNSISVTVPGSSGSSVTQVASPLYVFCGSTFALPFSLADGSTNLCIPLADSLQSSDGNSIEGTLANATINTADQNTIRWDLNLPTLSDSYNLVIDGYPSDLVSAGVTDVTNPHTNTLTQSFMSNPANFLVVAVETTTGGAKLIHTAGNLKLTTPPYDALSGTAGPAPSNDDISDAIVIDPRVAGSAPGYKNTENTSLATPLEFASPNGGTFLHPAVPGDPDLSTCLGFSGPSDPNNYTQGAIFRTVWYSYLPTSDGLMNVSTAASRYDTVVAVLEGTPGSLSLVSGGCDDDNGTQLQAAVSNVPVVQGTQYYVVVGESPTVVGALCQQSTATCPFDPNPPPSSTLLSAPLSDDATLFLSLTGPAASAAPAVALDPGSLAFGNQSVGTTSPAMTAILSNTGTAALSLNSIKASGNFAQTNNCGSSLAPGGKCTISVTFTPLATGTRTGSVTIVDNASDSPQLISLSGAGVASSSCQTIDYSKGFTTSGLSLNGGATVTDDLLQLTDGLSNEARSAFYKTAVPVTDFTTDFTFQLLNPDADGMTFTIQSNNPKEVGNSGGGLGYAGIPNSVAVKLDLFDNRGEGSDSTGLYFNGAYPGTPALSLYPAGINLHSGHVFAIHITYSHDQGEGTITDTATGQTASMSLQGDLSKLVGDTAYVGFTGGTGSLTAIQNILTWSYTGGTGCNK
jgi:hypothetical protein